tara:strand:+ start:129 stop:830 length:702 start_codon:yes stop_codon:yes gene_type:complete
MGKWGWEQVTTTSKKHKLGTIMQIADTEYRYCLSGGTLIAGQLHESSAIEANEDDDLVVATTGSVGGKTIGVTFGGAVTKDEYADGFLISNVDASDALGWRYRIKGNAAGTSDVEVTIDHEDGFVTQWLAGTAKAGAFKSPWSGVVVSATTAVGPAVGVTVSDIANGSYGWLQTKGPALCKVQGTIGIGLGVMRSNGTAGAVELNDGSLQNIGAIGRTASVDGQFHNVILNIV